MKRARFETTKDEDSVTESESDTELRAALLARARAASGMNSAQGSYYSPGNVTLFLLSFFFITQIMTTIQ